MATEWVAVVSLKMYSARPWLQFAPARILVFYHSRWLAGVLAMSGSADVELVLFFCHTPCLAEGFQEHACFQIKNCSVHTAHQQHDSTQRPPAVTQMHAHYPPRCWLIRCETTETLRLARRPKRTTPRPELPTNASPNMLTSAPGPCSLSFLYPRRPLLYSRAPLLFPPSSSQNP